MPAGGKQSVSVARGAGGGVAQPARAHDHGVGGHALAAFQQYAAHRAAINCQRLYARVQPHRNVQRLQLPGKRAGHVACFPAGGKHAVSALRLRGAAHAFQQLHQPPRGKRRKRREQKPRIAHHALHKLVGLAQVGHVAAALARQVELFAELLVALQQHRFAALLGRGERRHQPSGSAADHCHAFTHGG